MFDGGKLLTINRNASSFFQITGVYWIATGILFIFDKSYFNGGDIFNSLLIAAGALICTEAITGLFIKSYERRKYFVVNTLHIIFNHFLLVFNFAITFHDYGSFGGNHSMFSHPLMGFNNYRFCSYKNSGIVLQFRLVD